MRAQDWSASPLGSPSAWPPALRAVVSLMLGSKFPMFVAWGPELGFLYNDAYVEILGAKHPAALGRPFNEIWSEIWPDIHPLIEAAMAGEATWREDLPLLMRRRGFDEQTWFTFSYSPARDENGRVRGLFCACQETTARVRAEQRQTEETERQRRMFEQAPGFICTLRGPDHVFDFVNQSYKRLFGDRGMVGKPAREAFPELAGQGFFELLDKVYATGERHVARAAPIRVRAVPDLPEQELFIDFIYAPITDAQGRIAGIFVEGYDVTQVHLEALERARAEATLRERERELQRLADALPVLVAYIDTDLRYRFANRLYEEWFPFRREEIEGRLVPDVLGEAAFETIRPRLDRALAGERVSFEQFMPYRDGPSRHVRVDYVPRFGPDGRVQGLYGLVQDVSEAKRAEAALRELNDTLERRVAEALAERRLLADVVEGTDMLVQVVDKDFRWLAINRAAAETFSRLFGVRRPRAGESMLALLAHLPEQRAALRVLWARALSGEDFVEIAEFGEAAHDRRSYEMRFRALRDEEGRVVGAYHFVQDVTERLREQARLKEAEAALVQAQKMEAVGQLTGGIAHDFNNLLGAVVGAFNLILRRPEDVDRMRRIAEQGRAAAERGAKLTGQLLAFSRAQRIELKPVVVTEVVEEMRELLARTLGPMIRLTVEPDATRASVLSDPVQLEMSILNLAINARDAMPEGGSLAIRVRRLRLEADPELAPGEAVELSVADTGVGMSPEVAARAFDPFFTTKGVGKGTGLGLSQVYGIAKQAGGAVRIESRPGLGATIRLILPRHEGRSPAPEAEPEAAPLAGDGPATVLVVDDDEDFRRILVASLDDLGYVVTEAADGAAALAALERAAPDLMILDFAMPGLNGAEVATAAQQLRPELPIVFASGYAETAAIERAAGQEALLLRKPFRLEDLQAAVTTALAAKN